MDRKRDVQKQFGRSADSYVRSAIHRAGDDLKKMVEMADVNGKETLLDIATGGGHTANTFAPLVKQVTALDLTKEMLVAAEAFMKGNGHDNVTFVEGDAEKLPFPDETFDIVTCRIAPHHFPNINQFVQEVHRVLKPGGQFLLDDNVAPEDDALDQFYNDVEKKRDYSHERAWKKTEWIRLIELSGLEIQQTHRFEKRFEFEPWCNRMHLPDKEKIALNEHMRNASDKAKKQFRIVIQDGNVESFWGEALLLKAVKGIG